MIVYVKDDLFNTTKNIICHGVNCVGGFGSGVAGQIALAFPMVKSAYLSKFNKEGWKLGDIQVVPFQTNQYIINCATQDEYLPRDIRHADYGAIELCMSKVKDFAMLHNLTIAVPKIGSGLAGGDWVVIENILKHIFDDYDVYVYYLEEKV